MKIYKIAQNATQFTAAQPANYDDLKNASDLIVRLSQQLTIILTGSKRIESSLKNITAMATQFQTMQQGMGNINIQGTLMQAINAPGTVSPLEASLNVLQNTIDSIKVLETLKLPETMKSVKAATIELGKIKTQLLALQPSLNRMGVLFDPVQIITSAVQSGNVEDSTSQVMGSINATISQAESQHH